MNWHLRLIAVASLLIACPANAQSVITDPPIGRVVTVSAGSNIFSATPIYSQEGLQTNADSRPSGWFGLGAQDIPSGTKLVRLEGGNSIGACVPEAGSFDPKGPCFYDEDHNGTFDRTSLDAGKISTKLKVPLPYSKATLSVAVQNLFQRVFLYQGATADSIRFSYREFNGTLARPAFTEEIVVPRDLFPAMVRIKDLQIEVLSVSGLGLTYRVVAGG